MGVVPRRDLGEGDIAKINYSRKACCRDIPFAIAFPWRPSPAPPSIGHCEPQGIQERGYLRAAPEATLLVRSEVVLRRLLLISSWLRGTELARVDTSSRSWWSSLRLRRRRLLCCWLLERHSLLIRLCDTTSSNRCRCFLGMKILGKRDKGGE